MTFEAGGRGETESPRFYPELVSEEDELTEQDIRDFNDYEVVEHGIEYGKAEVSYEGLEELSEKMKKVLSDIVVAAREYMRLNVVKDKFASNHNKRRKITILMQRRFGRESTKTQRNNRFRLNGMTMMISGIDLMVNVLDDKNINTESANVLRRLAKDLPQIDEIHPESYDAMSYDEKLQVVEKMTKGAQTILDQFTKNADENIVSAEEERAA